MNRSYKTLRLLLGAIALFSLTSCGGAPAITESSTPAAAGADAIANSPVARPASPPETTASQPAEAVGTPNTPVSAVTPAADGLSQAQRASLKELGIPVVVPGYLPANFRVTNLIANACPPGVPQTGNCREGSSYTIVYRNDQNTCLLVNAIAGGVGGGASEFEFITQTALFGEVNILFGSDSGANQQPTAQQLNTPQVRLSSFPAALKANQGRSPYYNVSVAGSEYEQSTYQCGNNSTITPLEMEKIVQGLVMGDG